MQSILESERLLFRSHVPADVDDYCAMEMDINVRRYVGGYPRSRQDAERRFADQLKGPSERLALWATVLKAEGAYIGRCGLYPHFDPQGEPTPGEAKLAFYIASKYWGRGFATEAGRAFINFGFTELLLTRIVASVEEGNEASLHVLRKLGFTKDYVENGERTFCHFALLRPHQYLPL